MDWTDKTRRDRFIFEMVDPFDLDSSRGYLKNVIEGSGRITQGYYTDTRVSATIEVADHNYVDYSLIRIHHYVDSMSENYHNELGTFFVSSRTEVDNQTNKETFNLTSMLDRISEDALPYNYVISKGKTAHEVLKDLFGKFNVAYSIASDASNKTYTSTVVYEVGSSVLSTILEIADEAKLRVDVNGHGVVTVSNYVTPSSKTPIFEFNKSNGTIVGPVTKTNNAFDAVNRVIVTSSKDDKTVVGYADVEDSSKIAYSKLGRRNASVEQISDLSPFTDQQAKNEAQKSIKDFDQDPSEYTFQGLYFPSNTGEAILINDVKTMLQTRDINLSAGMVCDYTLKEV